MERGARLLFFRRHCDFVQDLRDEARLQVVEQAARDAFNHGPLNRGHVGTAPAQARRAS